MDAGKGMQGNVTTSFFCSLFVFGCAVFCTARENISNSFGRIEGTIMLNSVKDALGSCEVAPQMLRNFRLPIQNRSIRRKKKNYDEQGF